MTTDRYNPAEFESRRYRRWLKERHFAPAPGRAPFCIVIPPPNVTGSLHMGHAWDETLQDVLIRWKRMQGYTTLWIPGMDHAGIATQWMVERQLRERGLTKEDLGREKFIQEVHAFKDSSHGTIVKQLQALGVSCDWEQERFTLDTGLSRAVRRVFVSLYEEGLIYRDKRLVSWCPRCLTALSDLEVKHEDRQGGLWHIRYPLSDGTGSIIVATTRPETMLGDTAVAVHPDDERYRHLVGQTVNLPLVQQALPIIADSYVDPEFGSGALKITPGHDPNDFEVGKRHGLPVVTVMNEDGSLAALVPEAYRGLDRFEARKRVVADLETRGLLEHHEPHAHQVGTCSRCGTIVEPRVSLQWFVRMEEMAQAAVEAVETKRIELLPEYQTKVFFEWMNNIQDWCISRQLWWGHRIPVWYCSSCDKVIVTDAAEPKACTKCGGNTLEQDPDVLDTWFSSGLWPFSTMGWPEETETLRTFYPTSVLVTGYDILFFWVARMIMLGLKFMGEVPFHQVFLHGMLRDENGEKMSKTKGNGIDPLEAIAEFGTDALRFTLAAQTVMGRDMVLHKSTIEGYRNFVNKLWNTNRFLIGHWEHLGGPSQAEAPALGLFDRWILGRLNHVAGEVNRLLEQRRFNEATKELYAFVWHEYADWYLELVKPVLYGDFGTEAQSAALSTLRHVLAESLKLLHPFMPFVTEELWEQLPQLLSTRNTEKSEAHGADSIMVQPYPAGNAPGVDEEEDEGAVAKAGHLIEVVGAVRGVRGEKLIKPKQKVDVIVASPSALLRDLIVQEQTIFAALTGAERVEVTEKLENPDGYASGVGRDFQVFLSFQDAINVGEERDRLGRELEKAEAKIDKITAKLKNPNFVEKAPSAIVAKNRQELDLLQAQASKISENLAHLARQ